MGGGTPHGEELRGTRYVGGSTEVRSEARGAGHWVSWVLSPRRREEGPHLSDQHLLTSFLGHRSRQVWRGALLLCDWVLHAAAGEERGTWSAERGCCPPTGSNPMDGAVILELGAGKAFYTLQVPLYHLVCDTCHVIHHIGYLNSPRNPPYWYFTFARQRQDITNLPVSVEMEREQQQALAGGCSERIRVHWYTGTL